MKPGGGNRFVEKNINRRGVEKNRERSVEYSVVGYKVTITFIIIFKCAERKASNVKIQFVQTIIQNIDTTRASIVKFLHRSKQCWCVRE
jgi:hypothetical protein